MPVSKIACYSIHSHFLVCETVVSQLLEILVDSLFYNSFTLVASQVLDFDDVDHFVILISYNYVRLNTLAKLLDSLLPVYFKVFDFKA